ncbi:IS1182 family transposase [Legionella fallonii]|uniref:Transposase n=1 Tax=Legionella fallonii LLAP-10 TaxID=1212491 RepID=A0A098GB22_9GAMM|nr:IS1182 family transposase [Legionella fallonii]CEG59182.1 transposase [Legionella fallonii LLAP-10]
MLGQPKDMSKDADYLLIDKLIPANHLLRKINHWFNLSIVNQLTEMYYCPNNGRPSIPPELYFRIMLLGALFGIHSTRRLIQEIQYNIAYRWFCGLSLTSSIPHHASLSRIKKRYPSEVFEQLFIAILEQCVSAGFLNKKDITTMTDSLLFNANASLNSMQRIDETERKTEMLTYKRLEKRKLLNKTHRSITDPDATLAFKQGTSRTLKYKAHVTIEKESRLIIAIKITTGATHDSQPYLEQLNYIENHLGFNIKETVADRAYGVGHIISTLHTSGIATTIPLFSTRSGTSGQIPGFYYDTGKDCYIGPANCELKRAKALCNDTATYHSKVNDCYNCSFSKECQAAKKNNGKFRVITRHIHSELFQQVITAMSTQPFKQTLSERLWKVEGIMNELKHYHGLGKARYRGLVNVQIQSYLAAIAINIKRFVFFLCLFFFSKLMVKRKPAFTTGRLVNIN